MRQNYNKLIRDLIPQHIEASGKQYQIEEMSEKEFRQALRRKLVEEAQEASEAGLESLVTELADLLEVMDAVMQVEGITLQQVKEEQTHRQKKRGGFERRFKLLWTE
jgi:predicted house-cleaning noncanonical NTP pyrophosphatase (MazG superfamily)